MAAAGQPRAGHGTENFHQLQLNLLTQAGPVDLVIMNVSDPLSKTSSGNRHVLHLTEYHGKLIRAILAGTVDLTDPTTVFLDNFLVRWGFLIPLLSPSGLQFVFELIFKVVVHLSIEQCNKNSHQLHTKKYVEPLNFTFVAHLHILCGIFGRSWNSTCRQWHT